jgi:hypothetical protein
MLFSTDVFSTSSATTSGLNNIGASFKSSSNAYCAGGENNVGAVVTTVDKINFSGDSRTTLGTGLAAGRFLNSGFSSSTAGYSLGGWNPAGSALQTDVYKFLFSDDSRTTLATGLPTGLGYAPQDINSTSAGYFMGGYTGVEVATVYKFTFSDDSRSTVSSLPAARRSATGFSNV